LKADFERYGEKIDDHVIMVDKVTGKPRGFGFFTFTRRCSVGKVMKD
jgi:RNA recognition motif-containing protein